MKKGVKMKVETNKKKYDTEFMFNGTFGAKNAKKIINKKSEKFFLSFILLIASYHFLVVSSDIGFFSAIYVTFLLGECSRAAIRCGGSGRAYPQRV